MRGKTESSGRKPAAVYEYRGSGDVIGFFRRKENREMTYVPRSAKPSFRHPRPD